MWIRKRLMFVFIACKMVVLWRGQDQVTIHWSVPTSPTINLWSSCPSVPGPAALSWTVTSDQLGWWTGASNQINYILHVVHQFIFCKSCQKQNIDGHVYVYGRNYGLFHVIICILVFDSIDFSLIFSFARWSIFNQFNTSGW